MKKILACCAIAMMALALQAQTSEKKMSGGKMGNGVEMSIEKMELQWASAGKMSNADEVAPLLADKFMELNSDGNMTDKSKTLEMVKKGKLEISEISDVKVTQFGNTAIATGAWRGKGTSMDGKALDAHERWVDTWQKMPSGKWQCIASAATAQKM